MYISSPQPLPVLVDEGARSLCTVKGLLPASSIRAVAHNLTRIDLPLTLLDE